MREPSRRTVLKSAAIAALAARVPVFAMRLKDDQAEIDPLVLWYEKPAGSWVEALPVGNGRIGAMIHGGISADLIELNDNTLYSGEPGGRDVKLDITKD